MCPALHRPNPGLFEQERVPCAAAEFTLDIVAGRLIRANAAGWQAWGLDPATVAPPIAIDSAMPALQRLREIVSGLGAASSSPELLTFWMARGVVRLACRVEMCSVAQGDVTVSVTDTA